jgi:hypothetical protein
VAQPTWQFWLVDAANNTLADLGLLAGVSVSYQRVGASVLQGSIPLTSDAAGALPDGGAYLKAYRTPAGGPPDEDRVLRFCGPVEADEIDGSNGTDSLLLTAYSPDAILENRFTAATYASATQRGTILKEIIDTANADDDTGIRTSTSNLETTNTTTINLTDSKPSIASLIAQFGEALDGCDVEFRPIEYASGKIADLVVYNRRGDWNEGVVFGYGPGTAANCTSMKRTRNRRALENVVQGISPTIDIESTDATSVATYGKRYGVVSLATETSQDEASAIALGRLAARSTAGALADYTATTSAQGAPRLWDDFDLGDIVTLDFRKGLEFNVLQKVEGVTIAIDANGVESMSSLTFRSAV